MLTSSQIKWAASHDWFLSDNGDGTIQVWERWVDAANGDDGERVIKWGHVEGFAALRAWAGY